MPKHEKSRFARCVSDGQLAKSCPFHEPGRIVSIETVIKQLAPLQSGSNQKADSITKETSLLITT